jgi:hypothetical protein
LFDKDNVSDGKYLNTDGTLTDSVNFITSDFIFVKENTQYHLPKTATRRLKYYDSNKNALTTSDWDITSGDNNQVLTIPANAEYIKFSINKTIIDISLYQFEEGSTATEYEPYGKVWYKKNAIGKKVLNGSEAWTYSSSNTVFYSDTIKSLALNGSEFLCTAYTKIANTTSFGNMTNGQTKYENNTSCRLIMKDTRYTDANNYKSWLSNNNVTLYYVLANPTYTIITSPTLISQLEAIEAQRSRYGTNVITSECEEGLPVRIGVSALLKEVA